MSTPWDQLAALMTGDPFDAVNVYPTPSENVTPDAVVIQPDEPWIGNSDAVWTDEERYVVTALVTASTPGDGLARLHALIHAVLHAARSASWEFDSVTAPAVNESTGTPFLAATVSLIYRNCEE